MKAFSLWQPWASLWARQRKRYETRHWAAKYRGPIAVHAAKIICTDVSAELREILEDEFGGHWAMDLPRGALIATAQLVDCVPSEDLAPHLEFEELVQGDFSAGRFGWQPEGMRELPRPIPCIGGRRIFNVPDELIGAEVAA